MKSILLLGFVIIIIGCKPSIYLQNSSVQLSKPFIDANEIFFEGSTTIIISPTEENANIVYTDSDGPKQKYESPIVVSESTQIVAQALGGGFVPSESAHIEVLQLPKNEIISITSERPLSEKYGRGGLDILIDRKKGDIDFNKGWLGYLGDTIVFELAFDIIDINQLVVSTLKNQEAWIFSPAQINVRLNGEIVSHTLPKELKNESGNSNIYTRIDIPKTSARNLKVEIIAPQLIPNWHSGAGSKPWIFIDEILIY